MQMLFAVKTNAFVQKMFKIGLIDFKEHGLCQGISSPAITTVME